MAPCSGRPGESCVRGRTGRMRTLPERARLITSRHGFRCCMGPLPLRGSPALPPPQRQARRPPAPGGSPPPPPPPPSARLADCRQAWQRKMQGLLLFLLWWAIYRRRVEEQSIALCLFHVLLAGERARPPSGAFCPQVFVLFGHEDRYIHPSYIYYVHTICALLCCLRIRTHG